MKRVFAMVLCAAMLLTLAGCGSDGDYKGLYEKYSGIIDSLEAEDYAGAMSQVAGLAQQAMEAGKEPQPEPQQVLCNRWYAYSMNDENAPAEFTVNADGTCTVGGESMTWMVNYSGENSVEAVINNGSENLYYVYCRRNEDAAVMSYCEIYTCKNTEYGITSDRQLATYMADPLAGTLIREWRLLEGDEEFTSNYLYIYRGSLSLNSSFNWVITSEKGGDTLTAHADSDSTDEQYTLVLAQRDGHYVLTVTEDTTGASALYYCEEYGYEQTWPEAIYGTAMRYLNNYLSNGSFWVDDQHYSENKALAWLYQNFSQAGDYKQSGEYLQRFTVLPSLLTNVERINTDQLGNENKSTLLSYTYDENGRITVARGSDFMETTGVNGGSYTPQQLAYDDAGKLSSVTLGNINGTVEGIGTPTYDENGRLASMHVQKTNGEYTATFTYDDQGRVIGLEIPKHTYNNDVVFAYTYDENGVLVQKVKTENEGYYTYTTDYTYENGALKEQLVTYAYRYGDGYTTKYVYTNDDQGRPLSAVITTTDPNSTYAAMRAEYTYEDIYFFDATGLTEAE